MNEQERIKLFYELSDIMKFSAPRSEALMIATGKWQLDILALDEKMGKHLSLYDDNACTYDGKADVSMKEAMRLAFGDRSVEIVELLINNK